MPKPRRTAEPAPCVVLPPRSHRGLWAGVDALANAVRPTLGPVGRNVALARDPATKAPELLDDAATIARRIIQLPDPDADMGAMVLRQAMWKVHEAVGDGTATTAVLFQAIVREGRRLIAAGENAMALREGLHWAAGRVAEALRRRARPLEGPEALARFALNVARDPELARVVGEIFDIVGADGYVQVEESQRPGLEREYVEGSYWKGSYLSPYMISDPVRGEAALDNAAVLVTDLGIHDATDVVPLLELVRRQGLTSLAIVANQMASTAISVLVANHQAGVVKSLAAKVDLYGDHLAGALEDIGVLTGARPLLQAMGASLAQVQASDLGRARRVWATSRHMGVAGGSGEARALRQHIATLRRRLKEAQTSDEQDALRSRVGRLRGGMATLLVGAHSDTEAAARKALAERTVAAMRLALSGGVVPGGGSALLRAATELRGLDMPARCAAGAAVLAQALAEPLRVIAANAGHEPAVVLGHVQASPDEHGWDAFSGQVVDTWQAGIVDPVEQLETVVQTAAHAAALLLTTDVLVRHAKPETATNP